MNPASIPWAKAPDGEPSTLVAALHRNAATYGSRIAFRERRSCHMP